MIANEIVFLEPTWASVGNGAITPPSAEIASSDLQLTAADTWVERLTDMPVTNGFRQAANSLIEGGAACAKHGNERLSEEAIACRKIFYEGLLGFTRPSSPSYGFGKAFERRSEAYPPTNRFIDVNRLFAAEGIDAGRVGRTFPESWIFLVPTLTEMIDDFKASIGPDNTRNILNSNARVLAYKSAPRKVEYSLRLGRLLEWPDEDTIEAIVKNPRYLTMETVRFGLHGQYIARHGSKDLTPYKVSRLFGTHPDRHIIALNQGIDEYSETYIKKVTDNMTPAERREAAKAILANPSTRNWLSSPIVMQHNRFHMVEEARESRRTTAIMNPDVTEGSDV
jgi:hypothetical protein